MKLLTILALCAIGGGGGDDPPKQPDLRIKPATTVRGLQVGVCLVGRVAKTVVRQGQRLVEGQRHATEGGPVAVLAVAVLVEVVAEVEDEIDLIIHGDGVVGVEVAERIVGARHHREAVAVDGAEGQGARAADDGFAAVVGKAVVVGATCVEAFHHDFRGVVTCDVRA